MRLSIPGGPKLAARVRRMFVPHIHMRTHEHIHTRMHVQFHTNLHIRMHMHVSKFTCIETYIKSNAHRHAPIQTH